jgi:hypothetical protein
MSVARRARQTWQRDHLECVEATPIGWASVRAMGVPEGEKQVPAARPTIQRRDTDIDMIVRELIALPWLTAGMKLGTGC